jgi:hypothetical protein
VPITPAGRTQHPAPPVRTYRRWRRMPPGFDDDHQLARIIGCPQCKAPGDRPCTGTGGKPSVRYIHLARRRAWQASTNAADFRRMTHRPARYQRDGFTPPEPASTRP